MHLPNCFLNTKFLYGTLVLCKMVWTNGVQWEKLLHTFLTV